MVSGEYDSGGEKVISPGRRNGKGFIGLFKSDASLVKLIQDVALNSGLYLFFKLSVRGSIKKSHQHR